MPEIIILGTASAIPDEIHDNTHMAIVGEKRVILVDCANNPMVRLNQAGIEPESVTDIILTHFHPDHVSGAPSLLMNLWLLGRQEAMQVYGLSHTIDRLESMMTLYSWENWPNFYPVKMNRLADEERVLVLEDEELRIFSSPVCHLVPTIGLRVEGVESGKAVVYSCDTTPCPAVVSLAQGADLLVHEATGAMPGHTSAQQAGEIARVAGVKALALIHFSHEDEQEQALVEQAQAAFGGPVSLARDFMTIEL